MNIPFHCLLMLSFCLWTFYTAKLYLNWCMTWALLLPQLTYNLYMKTPGVHSYNTHSSTSNNFYIKASRLEIQKKTFSIIGAKLWNEIPSCLRELPKKSFKHRIKNKLLSVLEDEGSFIEVRRIIPKLKCQ